MKQYALAAVLCLAAAAQGAANPTASAASPVKATAVAGRLPALCERFAARLPSVPQPLCESPQLLDSGARSIGGTPPYLRDIGAGNAKLRVLWLDLLRWMAARNPGEGAAASR